MSPDVNAPTSSSEKFANVVFAGLFFIYALLSGMSLIMVLVWVWRYVPDGDAVVLIIAASGLAFLFSFRLARSAWREARGMTCRPGCLSFTGRAVLIGKTSRKEADDTDAGAGQ